MTLTINCNDPDFRVKQFIKFYDLLMKNAPERYSPWFFPCTKNGKNPSAKAISKIDSKSGGSWKHPSARLSKEQCINHIKNGFNIGISAREGDTLIIGDIDEKKYLSQCPKNTLKTISRKREGCHFFGWNKDNSAKINLTTDFGEIRSSDQYVLTPGSYVPFNLKSEKEIKAFEKLSDESKKDKLLGHYTLGSNDSPKEIVFEDFPDFFKEQSKRDIEAESLQKERSEIKKNKRDSFSSLKVLDIIGSLPESKRFGHPLHESDTDANFSLSKDGSLGHCWRHLVSLNAFQFLAVESGYAKCQDAGTPHKNRGVSKIKGDNEAYEIAKKRAIELGLIDEKEEKRMEFLIWVEKFNSYIVNIETVADYFCKEFSFLTVRGKKSDVLYVWDGKIYNQNAKSLIKEKCELLLGRYAKISPVNEIIAKIERRKYISSQEFEIVNRNLIPLENGVYNLENDKLEDHSPENYFKTILPLEYNPDAECKVFLKFISESLYPEDIPVIQEWFGFNLFREYLIKKALICLGERDTGKTVLLEALSDFIGEKNRTGLSLQKIGSNNDFVKLSLRNKYSNIYDDLSSKDINDGGNFKIATGGGNISAEEKFGDYHQFRNFAKHIFATNKIPPVKDSDDMAYYSRWIIVRFDNTPEKKDLFLKEKIREEKSGIFNWALEGLKRLLKNGKFSYNHSPEEIKFVMEMSGDPLIQFGESVLIQSNEKVSKENMYEVYCLWASENNKPILSKEQLGRRLNQKVTYLVAKTGAKERFWDKCSINEEWMKKTKNAENNNKLDTLDAFRENLRKPLRGYIPSTDNSNNIKNNNVNDIYNNISLKASKVSNSRDSVLDFSNSKILEVSNE